MIESELAKLDTAIDAVAGAESVDHGLAAIAEFAVSNREAPLLWEREARHLTPEEFQPFASHLQATRRRFAAAIPSGESDLISELRAGAALSALLSPAFHGVNPPPEAFRATLEGLARRILDVPLPPAVEAQPRPVGRGLKPSSKRELIIQAALQIFREQTYAGTRLEDIAASVGLSTSSLYNHIDSKADILETVLLRGNGYLHMTMDDILASATDERGALQELLRVFADFAIRRSDVADTLVTEIRNLGETTEQLMRGQREYVREWVHLFMILHPDRGHQEAQAEVQGCIMMMIDVARERKYQGIANIAEILAALAIAALIY
ncbi:TetR/AcrR family transcriptional regulator [Nocardioides alcanivorans]|uniref:TetR/AcrR family transcriptional regulator n=1 Tax=Nocardioides alcanivorans TaxID=2897352 RepID=UPI001F355DF2|nr:TetR/AcrR family transcriptional regulator [Nocardioides alcanivorans]